LVAQAALGEQCRARFERSIEAKSFADGTKERRNYRHSIQPQAVAGFRRTYTDLFHAHAKLRILVAKAAFDAPPFGAFSSRALAYLSTRTRRQTPRQSSAMSWPVGLNFYATIIETRGKLEVESPAAFGAHLAFADRCAAFAQKGNHS
jgi:hypothetical protein